MSNNKLLRIEFPKVRKIVKKGNTYYEVDCRSVHWQGQPKFTRSKKREALDLARQIAEQVRQHGIASTSSQSQQLSDDRLNHWTAQVKEHGGDSIADAVKLFVENGQKKAETSNSPLISELALKWFEDKSTDSKKKLRQQTISGIRKHANQFAKHFANFRVGTVTLKDLEAVEDSLTKEDGTPLNQQTRRNYVNYLRQFFNWCIRKEYTDKNPADNIQITVPPKEPTFLTVAQCQQLLELVQSDTHRPLVGFITSCLFAGLRPAEAERLSWNEIEFDHDSIVITADITKTKRGRRVEIPKNLKQWLEGLDKTQDLIPANMKRRIAAFRNEVSKTITRWTPDVLRHTYATFWLSKHNNRAKLAELMGNTESIIGKHYLRHPNKVDTATFWSLVPTNPKAEEFFAAT